MKYLVSFLMFLGNLTLNAQSLNPQLFLKSSDLLHSSGSGGDKIVKINKTQWSGVIKVSYGNGMTKKYNPDSIWGFRDTKGDIYRTFWGDIYKLKQIDTLCIFSKINFNDRPSNTYYYFSKTIDDDIYPLNEKNIKDHIVNGDCILDKFEKWFKKEQNILKIFIKVYYFDYDDEQKRYRINEFYSECKK